MSCLARSIQHIHTVPWPKTSSVFTQGQPLLHRPRSSEREWHLCMVDLLPCGSVHTPVINCTMLTIHSVQADSPIADTFCLPLQFLHRASLCSTDKETQEENVYGGPFPLHCLAISCTDSPLTKRFSFSSIFMEDQPLLYRSRNSGRECAWWTNSFVGQYLHQLSLVQSSRSIQHRQTVPW